jgi:hypothetical protein
MLNSAILYAHYEWSIFMLKITYDLSRAASSINHYLVDMRNNSWEDLQSIWKGPESATFLKTTSKVFSLVSLFFSYASISFFQKITSILSSSFSFAHVFNLFVHQVPIKP